MFHRIYHSSFFRDSYCYQPSHINLRRAHNLKLNSHFAKTNTFHNYPLSLDITDWKSLPEITVLETNHAKFSDLCKAHLTSGFRLSKCLFNINYFFLYLCSLYGLSNICLLFTINITVIREPSLLIFFTISTLM